MGIETAMGVVMFAMTALASPATETGFEEEVLLR